MGRESQRADPSVVADLLKGAMDMHVHSAPDIISRKVDDLELVAQARLVGMGGLVLKAHHAPTAGRAHLLQKLFPDIQVVGSICLNSALGGLNAEAVHVAVAMGAKVVWLPTVSALNHLQQAAHSASLAAVGGGTWSTGISLFQESGKLKAEVIEVLEVVKRANLILHTGHISVRESKAVVEEALALGIEKIVITHPEFRAINMSLADQRELAARGCYFERDFACTTGDSPRDPAELATAIKTVGAGSTIMATDFGQPRNDLPVEGMRRYIAAMLEHHISEKDIETMVKANPAKLLGLA